MNKKVTAVLLAIIIAAAGLYLYSATNPMISSATPGPVNITGTIYKIDDSGFFLRSDEIVNPEWASEIQTKNVYVYTSHPILGSPKNIPNITIGMKVKVNGALVVFKPGGNETYKPADTNLEYKEGALSFITRQSIEQI